MQQGTNDWLEKRKLYVTSTDSSIIMGLSPYKTPYKLWRQKMDLDPPDEVNEKMRRGSEMEPVARNYLATEFGIICYPQVIFSCEHDFMMASLDGLTNDCKTIIEIKCGEKSYQQALIGEIPPYYLCQIQHQIAAGDAKSAKYFAFNGETGILIDVPRDDEFIKTMIEKEKEFYQCLISFTPPALTKKDFVTIESDTWMELSTKYAQISEEMDILEEQQKKLKNQLITLCGGLNSTGNGINVSKISAKGRIDYDKIIERYNVDIELYRKNHIEYWKITKGKI